MCLCHLWLSVVVDKKICGNEDLAFLGFFGGRGLVLGLACGVICLKVAWDVFL